MAVEKLKPNVVALTPSYALHLAEWAAARGVDLANSSVERLMVAGEPGGGEPAMRAKLEAAWGASVTEAMALATYRLRCGASARPRPACISPAAASSISS